VAARVGLRAPEVPPAATPATHNAYFAARERSGSAILVIIGRVP